MMKLLLAPIVVVFDRCISGVSRRNMKLVIFVVLLLLPGGTLAEQQERRKIIQMNAPTIQSLSEFLDKKSPLPSSASSPSFTSPIKAIKEDSMTSSLKMSVSSREVYKPVFRLHTTTMSVVHSNNADEERRLLISPTSHDLKLHQDENAFSNTMLKDTETAVNQSAPTSCDVQFMECLGHTKCVACFEDFEKQNIDWSIIAPNTPCNDVLNVVVAKNGLCSNLMNDNVEQRVFCQTFDSCVIWKQDDSNAPPDGENDASQDGSNKEENMYGNAIDCDTLTSCDWKGIKRGYIGDGICHDFIDGCYNTKVCNFDGGDCCPDTCNNSSNAYGGKKCGSDGYLCRDPQSEFCQTCNSMNSTDNSSSSPPRCETGKIPYKLFQYDSFGDGWDKTEMTITNSREDHTHTPLYDGRLQDGSVGMEYVCLSTQPACYQVKLFGGYWGNEVSWEIKPMKHGSPAIASGGAPMDCEFPVSGAHCENTCTGRSNVDAQEDEKYHTWHKMANCIQDKCILQLGLCENDLVCSSCVGDNNTPAYCLASDLFNALGLCTECNCVEDTDNGQKKEFCQQKSRERHENEQDTWNGSDQNTENSPSSSKRVRACSSEDFQSGLKSLNEYAECSGVDTMSALLTNFDLDNFGMLDAFEDCSSKYAVRKVGVSALDCMKILQDAIVNPGKVTDQSKADLPVQAISSLAKDLLYDGEQFCDCSFKTSSTTPVCQDFIHFKTLLYESLDGCRALDSIDCDAWTEFYVPCKSNLVNKFQNIDFRNKKQQCDYVKDGCGNIGPLPSFRHLNCAQEITQDAWNFYLNFAENCLKNEPWDNSKLPHAPEAPMATRDTTTDDNYSPEDAPGGGFMPYYQNNSSEKKKKYIPPEKRRKASSRGHKVRNIVFFFILAGGAYWYFRTHFGDFDYHRFRWSRGNYYYGDSGNAMYDSLTMQNAEASFVPPTLPPPPSAYENPAVNSFPMHNINNAFQG